MNIKKYLLGLILFCSNFLHASELDIFGYYEGAHIISAAASTYQVSNNKVRLDINKEYADNLIFGSNINFCNYNGKKSWNMLDFIPKKHRSDINSNSINSYDIEYQDEIELENAFAKISFKYADITLGKQQISLGTGYAWNPTDIFNDKDLIDPSGTQPGNNAYRFDIPVYKRYSITAIYAPEEDYDLSSKLIRLKGTAGHFDYSLIGIDMEKEEINFSDFSMFQSRRKLAGADLAGELLGLGLWSEFAYNYIDNSRDYSEWIAGCDYTFTSGFYLMLEYYRNSSKECKKSEYSLNDWLKYIYGYSKGVSRDQLYSVFTYPASDILLAGISIVSNLNDSSCLLMPTLNYSMYENVDIELYISINTGSKNSTFDQELPNASITNLKVYF